MATIQFSMVVDGVERVKDYVIPDSLLIPQHIPPHMTRYSNPEVIYRYRQSVIAKHAEKWALSHINLTWREIHHEQTDGNHADNEHREATQQPPAAT